MFTKPEQRSTSYSEEVYGTEATEKTIPFLRRLVDMLSENENVISFCPGFIENGQATLGRIVVHDRIKVENEILPRYFNHSSFASLRRQLNYFSFTRIGKGRQKGATYCNEGVIVIEDILRLRRRSTTVSNSLANDNNLVTASNRRSENMGSQVTKAVSLTPNKLTLISQGNKSKRAIIESAFQESSHRSQQQMKKFRQTSSNDTKANESVLHIDAPPITPTLVSPSISPLHSPSISPNDALKVTLDLTVPKPQIPRTSISTQKNMNEIGSNLSGSNINTSQPDHRNLSYSEDPDILAGCRALLSISHGIHSLTA
mmetsp:Transcript_27020/g.63433  ORF Transcript_27020/g.63433 Transcript_27020/m.63433 type:complete len:315 (+) Transcript_27020:93-1037(+)|eukprot:CAMPEP_0197193932 /NCGR_PEP_ID=MMETSP1423-20130617/28276_1 /TAXON_ID=476441 /ORGANISM="Pseudo-nitzschia heimii, Strain UNC1101" /LENGTH=314 /DNA_ID=CAMNT_0042647259 /DNA_START=33 /DNA_END=977 /DNA_ORIENTATION=+